MTGRRAPTGWELALALAVAALVTWWALWAVIGLNPARTVEPVPTTWHSGPGDNVVIHP